MRSKVGIGTIAVTAVLAFGGCSGPLNDRLPEKPVAAEPANAPPEKKSAQPQEKSKEEPVAKPKEEPCPKVVYEPDERCGLERRPWRGIPITEVELKKDERAEMAVKEFLGCLGRWARMCGPRIKAGETFHGDECNPDCEAESKKADALSTGRNSLMYCGRDGKRHAFIMEKGGVRINHEPDIYIKWDQVSSTLTIQTQDGKMYLFKLANQPRYGLAPVGDGKTSDLVIWTLTKQIHISLDSSCRPEYKIYE